MRPFRFGFQVGHGSADEIVAQARAAEAAGFDVVHTWDHVVDGWSPLAPLGRTLPDGDRHAVRWEPERLDATIGLIRSAAGVRWPLELQALVQVVEITDDRVGVAERLAAEVEGLAVDDALATPFLALGTPDEIAAQLVAARERWGISYFSVRAADPFAPVIERLRAIDARCRSSLLEA